jgi:hypothetical protein
MTMRQVVYLQDAIGLRKKALDRWATLSTGVSGHLLRHA